MSKRKDSSKKDTLIAVVKKIATKDATTNKWCLPPDFCSMLSIKQRTLNKKQKNCVSYEDKKLLLFWILEDNTEDRIVKEICWCGTINGTKYDNLYLTAEWGALPDGTGTLQRFVQMIESYEKICQKKILSGDEMRILSTPDSSTSQKLSRSQFVSMRNLIVFGAPGTGKSHCLEGLRGAKKKEVIDGNDSDEDFFKSFERVTFYPTYSYAQFVGSYKPVMKEVDKDGFEVDREQNGVRTRRAIAYEFVPGPFLRILKDALRNDDKNYLLIIEEINRANAAAVFGDVFQLLDRDDDGSSEYSITPCREVIEYLMAKDVEGIDGISKDDAEELRIPSNLYIWATMNSADQGVYPLDTAFKRRWDFEYRSLDNNISNDKCVVKVGKDCNCKWGVLRKAINSVLKRNQINEDKLLSSSFVQPDGEDVISSNRFKMKVLMYLWEDAARMCRKSVFADAVDVFSDLMKEWDSVKYEEGDGTLLGKVFRFNDFEEAQLKFTKRDEAELKDKPVSTGAAEENPGDGADGENGATDDAEKASRPNEGDTPGKDNNQKPNV